MKPRQVTVHSTPALEIDGALYAAEQRAPQRLEAMLGRAG